MQFRRKKYLNDLILRKGNGMVKVVTGIRRCGKSYLLNKIFYQYLIRQRVRKDHIIRFAFDSADDLSLIGEDLIEIQKENRKVNPQKFISYIKSKVKGRETFYILLDEIQLLDSFESVLNGYLYKKNIDLYVTGSNSKFLSSDVLTEFRGRGDEVHVFPLTFAEFYSAFKGDKYEAWNEYFLYGGLPFAAKLETDEQKVRYLQDLFEETYVKDIIEHNQIRKSQELENLIDILASASGSLTNATKIQKTFSSTIKSKITVDTIISYVNYLKEAFVINEARRYDVKGRKYIGSQQKYYFEDVGLRNARLNFRQTEENHLMENIIYNELLYRGFSVDVGVVEKRQKDKNGKEKRSALEIDFVANKGARRYYIQSAFAIPDAKKAAQEKASFLNTRDSFTKILVVKEPVKMARDENGIITVGIFDFLLKQNSLELPN